MQNRILTSEIIDDFCEYLYREEKSKNTIEKYVRDVRSFISKMQTNFEITKETVITYKNRLISENYAVRSIN